MNSKGVKPSHYGRANKLVKSFIDGLAAIRESCQSFYMTVLVSDGFSLSDIKDGCQVYAKVLKPVVNLFKGRNKADYIPHLLVLCSGPMDTKKRDLVNHTMVDWQLRLKKKKLQKGSAHGTHLCCAFLSRMARDFE